jgi:DNA-binding transcriptional MerR regulator
LAQAYGTPRYKNDGGIAVKDLFTVREFAELSGVSASTLRYWDKIGLFSPAKRESESGYRSYSLVQILALNFFTVLSDLGIPLKTIGEFRRERDAEKLLRLLEKRERELDLELRTLRERSSVIHARQELIRSGLKADGTQVCVAAMEEKAMLLGPQNEYEEGDTFVGPLASFVNQAKELRVNFSFPVGGYWEDMASFVAAPGKPDRFFTIDPLGTHIRKAGDYITGATFGYYAVMGDLPQRMEAFMKERRLTPDGPVYTIYLHDEICTKERNRYLGQSCVAFKKTK